MAKKKVKAKETLPEVGLRVVHDSYQCVTREYNDEGPYSRRDDTRTTWTVDGIELVDQYPDVTACFPLETGDSVYLVYVVYSTGDSFGHDEDHSIAFIDVFKTEERAKLAARGIREHRDWYCSTRSSRMTPAEARKLRGKYASEHSVDLVREDGTVHMVCASWNGYFESLSYVEVAHFAVDAGKRERF